MTESSLEGASYLSGSTLRPSSASDSDQSTFDGYWIGNDDETKKERNEVLASILRNHMSQMGPVDWNGEGAGQFYRGKFRRPEGQDYHYLIFFELKSYHQQIIYCYTSLSKVNEAIQADIEDERYAGFKRLLGIYLEDYSLDDPEHWPRVRIHPQTIDPSLFQ